MRFQSWADSIAHRIIPDHWLMQAELLEGGRLLRLNYSFCVIEISGQCLDPLFEDAGTGKLNTVLAATSETMPNGQLWVASIVVIPPPKSHFPESEEERFDA